MYSRIYSIYYIFRIPSARIAVLLRLSHCFSGPWSVIKYGDPSTRYERCFFLDQQQISGNVSRTFPGNIQGCTFFKNFKYQPTPITV